MLMLQNFQAVLRERRPLAPEVYSFNFTLKNPAYLEFSSGQYLLLEVPGGFRQYSISSSPNTRESVEIIVDTSPMGVGSKYLLGLSEGDEIKFRAPLGVFVLKQNDRPKIFLATGAGIAPIKSMILELLEKNSPAPIHLFWGVREASNLYLKEFWTKLDQQYPKFDYTYCLSRDARQLSHYFSGRIQENLRANELSLANTDIYLCGRVSTIEQLKEFLEKNLEVPAENLYNEKFT